MNTRAKTILMAAAFAAAASALGSQAADKDAASQPQKQVTPASYGPEATVALYDTTDGESAHTAAENAWLIQERIQDSNGSKPLPFVAPAATTTADSDASR
jgi:hypothetical protein